MIQVFDRQSVFVSVISARRPQAMKPMTELIGDATWFVDAASVDAYTQELAKHDLASHVVVADALCRARNAALDAAFSPNPLTMCLQLSDDLKKIEEPIFDKGKSKFVAKQLDFKSAVTRMILGLRSTGAKLAGVAPTANPFYYRGKTVHPRAFIVGDMMLVRSSSPRFDEEMRLKEDYDFTLQHIKAYGMVARCDNVLATFQHRSNPGGAVAYRTPLEEQRAIDQLKEKYGKLIQDNPKRPNEILLKLR